MPDDEYTDPIVSEVTAIPSEYHLLEFKVRDLSAKVQRLEHHNKVLTKNLQSSQREVKDLKKRLLIPNFLGPDQQSLLHSRSKSMRGGAWSYDTIKKALQLRFACGLTGYQTLLQQGYPLPAVRTLSNRTEHIKFESGVLTEVIEMLRIKVLSMNTTDRYCCLTLDEMAITPGQKFDRRTDTMIGNVTLPDHNGTATKALVVMLAGICSRWKQTIGYWFTPSGCDGKVFHPILKDIIDQAKDIGLHVLALTSDMGGSNLAMWKSFGVKVGKNSEWITKIPHPSLPDEELYFLADDPHLVKNVKAALCNGQDFLIPEEFVLQHNLPSSTATIRHIKQLLEFDAEHQLKLVPGLELKDLDPAHFDKMNVGKALRFISRATSAALHYLVEAHNFPDELKTTAWLLDTLRKWFDLISSRTSQLALSKFSSEKHEEAVLFLEDIIKLFLSIKIGSKGFWKPIQTGIITTTKSILGLQDLLLGKKGLLYVMTSRFSQDALENLFSQVRLKNPIPTAHEFKTNLRSITIAQYLTEKKTSSYQNDESEYLADFLTQSTKRNPTLKPAPKLFLSSPITTDESIHTKEIAVLKYIAGHTIYKVKKTSTTCESCVGAVLNPDPDNNSPSFIRFRDYTGHSLLNVSDKIFEEVFLQAEMQFRHMIRCGVKDSKYLVHSLTSTFLQTSSYKGKDLCHGMLCKMLKAFFGLRLSAHAGLETRKKKKEILDKKKGSEKSSKSQQMRKSVSTMK